MFNGYNLYGVDVNTMDNYVPGLSSAVISNCHDKDGNCCINQCNNICKNGDCDRNWKDICSSNCDDLVQQLQGPKKDPDNPQPPNPQPPNPQPYNPQPPSPQPPSPQPPNFFSPLKIVIIVFIIILFMVLFIYDCV